MKELIATRVSTKDLTFEPGGQPAEFDVTVLNNSEQFATFQVEVQAAGAETSSGHSWYRLSPEICTKKPPGDSTQFSVQVTDVPKPGFVGLMNLTVRVFSLDLRDAENRQVLRLTVPGAGVMAPELKFPLQEFCGEPGDRLKIPLSVTNFNRQSATVTLRIQGLDASWFPAGTEQIIQLSPSGSADVVFNCQLPDIADAASGTYAFTIVATQPQAAIAQVGGSITLLPQGRLVFRAKLLMQRIPPSLRKWQSFTAKTAVYKLSVENQSNLCPTVQATVVEQTASRSTAPLARSLRSLAARLQIFRRSQKRFPLLEVVPEQIEVDRGATETMTLTVQHRRPWWGGTRFKRFQATATSDSEVDIHSDTHTLELQVLPLIPVWLQFASGAALLLLLWWGLPDWLSRQHTAPVNSVRLNGLGSEAISVSSDRTVQHWRIKGDHLHSGGVLHESDKSVRVVRYRPVNNDRVAVGYENGEMQVLNLLTGEVSPPFVARTEDRVFDLVFAEDARSLFSGHGSGQVLQWTLDPAGTPPTQPRSKQVGFSINALALVGNNQTHLAIAGRFNQLTLWNLKTNQLTPVPNGSGSERDYIFSLASAPQKPFLLATADNTGRIKLWNLRSCLTSSAACELRDEWTADSRAIRAIALSEDGCYLASAGDDGQAKLWPLTATGKRQAEARIVGRSSKSLNAIDLLRVRDELTIVSGGDDYQVKLYRVKQPNSECR